MEKFVERLKYLLNVVTWWAFNFLTITEIAKNISRSFEKPRGYQMNNCRYLKPNCFLCCFDFWNHFVCSHLGWSRRQIDGLGIIAVCICWRPTLKIYISFNYASGLYNQKLKKTKSSKYVEPFIISFRNKLQYIKI